MQNRPDVLWLEIGEVRKDFILAHATGQVLQHIGHGDACTDNAGLTAAHTWSTGNQLLAGSHIPSPVDDSETLAMPRGDTTAALQEIESRVTARAFAAVMDPTKGPAVREVLERLAAVLDETSEDGVI